MPSTGSRPLPGLRKIAALLALFVLAGPIGAAPEDTPAPKGGSTYANQKLGVSARSPDGWKMVVDSSGGPSAWVRLVTFNDSATDAQATLSVRPRRAGSMDALMANVRKAWDVSRDRLRMDSIKKVEPSALEPIGNVVVEGSFTRAARPEPAKDGVAPPPAPPVTYQVRATYLLGASHEYLLYAQGQRTHWSRLRGPLAKLAASIKFDAPTRNEVKGVGAYRSEEYGFACRFPKDYTVVAPQRSSHAVRFDGPTPQDPVLSVYVFPWEESADKDAQRLVTHYLEDKGGSASTRSREVAGQEAVLVTAEAVLGGEERTILIAVLKRGDTCFRLRASIPKSATAAGTAVFDKFLDGFQMQAAPK